MPELPEIHILARQMHNELQGKTISRVEVIQDKCLNMPVDEFVSMVTGKIVGQIHSKGKWIFAGLGDEATLLLNLGMGGDVLYHQPGDKMPDKYKLKLDFTDGTSLSINFWWFGYVHSVKNAELGSHKMTSTLGIVPVRQEFTLDCFRDLVRGKKGSVKSMLMDQKAIAGIGNVYVQDILFKAGLHPNRKLSQLTDSEIENLYEAIVDRLSFALAHRGLKYERDLYGRQGEIESFLVGYREGQPCPACGTTIEKIKTGSTSSYICKQCQPLK